MFDETTQISGGENTSDLLIAIEHHRYPTPLGDHHDGLANSRTFGEHWQILPQHHLIDAYDELSTEGPPGVQPSKILPPEPFFLKQLDRGRELIIKSVFDGLKGLAFQADDSPPLRQDFVAGQGRVLATWLRLSTYAPQAASHWPRAFNSSSQNSRTAPCPPRFVKWHE